MDDFPGDVVVYKSIDTVPDQNAVTDPTKFLNSFELLGMPPHILKLKVGAPVMVLQNIHPLYLYNGTQCIVRLLGAIALKRQLPQAIAKNRIFSATDSLIPSDSNIPFEFKRLQFPVRVCFAMSTNKAQVSIYKHPAFHMGCTMLGAHRLAHQEICSFVHLVVRLGMLFLIFQHAYMCILFVVYISCTLYSYYRNKLYKLL